MFGLVLHRSLTGFEQLARSAEVQELQGKARESSNRGVLHQARARPVVGDATRLLGSTELDGTQVAPGPVAAADEARRAIAVLDQERATADQQTAGYSRGVGKRHHVSSVPTSRRMAPAGGDRLPRGEAPKT